jgi:putative hydrolase of the HAD superfamily
LKFVFFDLDDTLLDHKHASSMGAEGFYRDHADVLGVSFSRFMKGWKQAGQLHMERYFRNEVSYQGQRRARVREVFAASGLTLTDAEADERFAVYLKYYEAEWRLFDDVLPCLDSIPESQMGIISNGDSGQQLKKLARMGLDGRFDPVVLSGEIGVAKPEPGIFVEAASRAGVEPSQCVYTGDRLETDAMAATAAGMSGIWLSRGGDGAAPAEVPVIHTLADLAERLANL